MFRRYHSSDLKTLADTIIGLSGEGTEVLWASPDAPLEVLCPPLPLALLHTVQLEAQRPHIGCGVDADNPRWAKSIQRPPPAAHL